MNAVAFGLRRHESTKVTLGQNAVDAVRNRCDLRPSCSASRAERRRDHAITQSRVVLGVAAVVDKVRQLVEMSLDQHGLNEGPNT